MRGAANRKIAGSEPGEDLAAPHIEFVKATGKLLPHIESYYLFRCGADEMDGIERVDLGQLRFLIRGEGEVTFPDGHTEPTRPIMVNGPGTAAATYKMLPSNASP